MTLSIDEGRFNENSHEYCTRLAFMGNSEPLVKFYIQQAIETSSLSADASVEEQVETILFHVLSHSINTIIYAIHTSFTNPLNETQSLRPGHPEYSRVDHEEFISELLSQILRNTLVELSNLIKTDIPDDFVAKFLISYLRKSFNTYHQEEDIEQAKVVFLERAINHIFNFVDYF